MPRPKGQPKTGGKKKGSLNKKSEQWLELGESIITIHSGRFNNVLSSMDDEKFAENFLKALSYFKPQLARTEVKAEVDNTVKIIEINADNSFTKPSHQSESDH